MIYDNVYELCDAIKKDIEYNNKLNILEMIGGEELKEYYKINKDKISFDLLQDNILAGYTLNEIKEAYEKVKYIDSSIMINHMLSLNLEMHKLKS